MSFLFPKKKPTALPVILFFLTIALLVGMGFFAYTWVRNLSSESIVSLVERPFVQNIIENQVGEERASLVSLFPKLAGFQEPVTYLLLFLNNTELRPGGGFIGSYAVVTVESGSVTIHKIEGTEVLDNNAPDDALPPPPDVYKNTLYVDYWYFRDSNWSPDFEESSKKGLELYAKEQGIFANDIDVVVGITSTVLEELLQELGPITIEGQTFTSDNVVEQLQYETSYGYEDRDLEFIERKSILRPFFDVLVEKVESSLFANLDTYLRLADRLINEKHILVYAVDEQLQSSLNKAGLTGVVQNPNGDSLLWVDANLAALKTDHAMERTLSYTIRPTDDGRFEAVAEMTYKHTGRFDWRTSRYLSYTRLYVPFGSELVSTGGTLGGKIADVGLELGKTWFGTSIRVEPGRTETLSFTYRLPPIIRTQAEAGVYTLLVQKQLGTVDHKLTLDLDFGTTIIAADPAEEEDQWYDSRYTVTSDLVVDREFQVSF